MSRIRFRYDGYLIKPANTPLSLNMENEVIIQVFN